MHHEGSDGADSRQPSFGAVGADPGNSSAARIGGADPWAIELDCSGEAVHERDETIFALSNGILGVRGGFCDIASVSQATYLAPVWERSPIMYHERLFGFAAHTDSRVPVPDATAIRLAIGDQQVDAAGELLELRRSLDLRTGMLRHRHRWRTPQGITFEVESERMVLQREPGVMCIRFRVRSSDYAGPIALVSSIEAGIRGVAQSDDPRVGAASGLKLQVLDAAGDLHCAGMDLVAPHSQIAVSCQQRHTGEGLVCMQAERGAVSVSQKFVGELLPGKDLILVKYVGYAWGVDRPAAKLLAAAAAQQVDSCLARGFAALAADQAEAFAELWSGADAAIELGDATDVARTQALRFNIFHVMQSIDRSGRYGIAAKGLSGEGYEGHVFWDAETFVLPVLVLTAPHLAKAHLEWRFRMLDAARRHAREMNHATGALYPWRTLAGDECSAHYPSGSAQYHINAAIAYAIKLYASATADLEFLYGQGAEMLAETARIWMQVGHFNKRRNGAFCINAVTGPDEYTAIVDNNYYTNHMAQQHLRYAAGVLRRLEQESPDRYAALVRAIGLKASEMDDWVQAADAMYLPYDENLGIVAQDDTFLDKPVWRGDGEQPLLLHNHPLTLYRHQICKQADALLAFLLAGEDISPEVKRRSFEYYEPLTVHDSTLSSSTFAILAAELGDTAKALSYFQRTLRIDLDDLHDNTSHGTHLAAMAGSWLALVWGFGGLRVQDGGLHFDPVLPRGWSGYRFTVRWQGRRITVVVHDGSVTYELAEGSEITILYGHRLLVLTPNGPVTVKSARSVPRGFAFPGRFRAVIFDLDGVLADTATLHARAWQRLMDELGLPWRAEYAQWTKGVDREASLDIVLGVACEKFSPEQKVALAARKNRYYRDALQFLDAAALLPGALAALNAIRDAGLKIALASASRNARDIVECLGIADYFDYITDPAVISRPKPDPEIFARAAEGLGLAASDCLAIEDAQSGVAAIRAAGMACVGIGSQDTLADADVVLASLKEFQLEQFVCVGQPHQPLVGCIGTLEAVQ
jgi:alpha,alpha-trehalose phosphorylase